MKQVILFRKDRDTEEEYEAALHCWQQNLFQYRSDIPSDAIVFGRYSVLPYYEELEIELSKRNSYLVNSYKQHTYISDIMNYYEDIKDFTPKTYTTWYDLESEFGWVLKGRTNSRKHQWNTMMYAKDSKQIAEVAGRLLDDTFIKEQGLVVREYVPLKRLDTGINGLPISKEWRCFYIKDKLIASGFYWASHPECYPGEIPPEALSYANNVAAIISKKTNFFVIDVAEKEDGGYIVIEINDGQMSGLSMISPSTFYLNLPLFFS